MGNIALFRLFLFHGLLRISAAVTIYYAPGQNPFSTTSADASSYTGAAAYNPTTIDPPALPDPLPSLSLDFNLQSNPTGLSITQSGAFMGFSVEMSVANQVCEFRSSVYERLFCSECGFRFFQWEKIRTYRVCFSHV